MENKTIEEVLAELLARIEDLEKEVTSLKDRMPHDSGRNHA